MPTTTNDALYDLVSRQGGLRSALALAALRGEALTTDDEGPTSVRPTVPASVGVSDTVRPGTNLSR